jgi:hypothetical protein
MVKRKKTNFCDLVTIFEMICTYPQLLLKIQENSHFFQSFAEKLRKKGDEF